jgi:4-alpha-glucanotransferase
MVIQAAKSAGIATRFRNWAGVETDAPIATQRAVLAALGVRPNAPGRDPWLRALPPCVVVRQSTGGIIEVLVDAGADANVTFELENGETVAALQQDNAVPDREVSGRWRGLASFRIPDGLPLGYHQIRLVSQGRDYTTRLIVVPDAVPLNAALAQGQIWGVMAQFYSVPSRESWGIGDFSDLAQLARWSAALGADYVLINPIHAGSWNLPVENSPYLPSTRLFVAPLYIRPEVAPGYAELSAERREHIAALKSELLQLTEQAAHIQRDPVWEAKRAALRCIFDAGVPEALQAEFDAFRAAKGHRLTYFAAWCVFSELYGEDWRTWEPMLRNPASPQSAREIAEHATEVAFVEWLQWVADRQWAAAQQAAKDAGMAIGVVTDLAIGVSKGGADAWILADTYAKGITVGAPPDGYNQLGQEWGQPPWRPDRLAELGYQPFVDVVRAALAHSGGVRIDHILGEFRLWWVPEGSNADQGAYVMYDHEALIGILALEATRAGAVIIGEDLGVVEPWVQGYLSGRGVFGTSVLWFENRADEVVQPEEWREFCLASVTTHDTPPAAGYLALEQIRVRHELGLLTAPLEEEIAAAKYDQGRWLDYLTARGLLGAGASVSDTVEALYRALTYAPSKLLCLALVDAVGERQMQNQPGTSTEYPNWQIWLSDAQGQRVYVDDLPNLEFPRRLATLLNTIKAPH